MDTTQPTASAPSNGRASGRGGKAATRRYEALVAHYGMIPTRNNRGVAHENGAIESRHGHAKSRVAQALLLRGDADFADLDAYRVFIADIIAAHNARHVRAIEFERALLQPLPDVRAMEWEEATVRVTVDARRSP